jgi:nitroimidazol reductase NimA-like FMN-containing flavoprotein (pyridoxamine 5'-phosphate oxidase superfamily)
MLSMQDAVVTPPPSDPPPRPGRPEVLTVDECWERMRRSSVGRLAFVVDGWPVVLPVNYAIDGTDVMVRSGPGSKLAAARQTSQMSLEVDAIDPVYRSGWSVLVFGLAEDVSHPAEVARLEQLALRSWAATPPMEWIRIRPASVTGRHLPKAWRYPGPTE